MDYDFWVLMMTSCVGFGVLINKVHQIEKRLNGNGSISIPGQCHVHQEQIVEHSRRLSLLETTNE